MTLRAVIAELLRGSDDAEAMLADNGFGDLPADMFSQALASYSDTAPMAEADALTPVLASLDAGDPSDVFAVLDEQPLVVVPQGPSTDLSMIGVAASGIDAALDAELDQTDELDEIDDFGVSVSDDAEAGSAEADTDDPFADEHQTDEPQDVGPEPAEQDPFAHDDLDHVETVDHADSFDDLFDTEPEATGDDPSDLDLDF